MHESGHFKRGVKKGTSIVPGANTSDKAQDEVTELLMKKMERAS